MKRKKNEVRKEGARATGDTVEKGIRISRVTETEEY